MNQSRSARRRSRTLKAFAVSSVVLVTVVVIWIDIRTSVWAEVVILSGITAGLVTFLFTALFVDRIITRAEQQRWLPVTHLAVSDLVHGLAHEDSEITRGDIRPRYLLLTEQPAEEISDEKLQRLLDSITVERDELAALLARWSAFLAVSADAQEFMGHMAEVTFDLDAVRDAVIAFEEDRTDANARQIRTQINIYNKRVSQSVSELRALLTATADARTGD